MSVCQQSWSMHYCHAELAASSSAVVRPLPVLILPSHRGMARLSWLNLPIWCESDLNPWTVTHPCTNQAWRRVPITNVCWSTPHVTTRCQTTTYIGLLTKLTLRSSSHGQLCVWNHWIHTQYSQLAICTYHIVIMTASTENKPAWLEMLLCPAGNTDYMALWAAED